MAGDAQSLYFELMHEIAMGGELPGCANDPELFFHESTMGGQSNAIFSAMRLKEMVAKTVCAECPFKMKCAEYAIVANEEHGIWGGLTPTERRTISSAKSNKPEQTTARRLFD